MKKIVMTMTVCAVVLALVAPGTLFAQEKKSAAELKKEASRAEINEIAEATLQTLFKANSKAKEIYDASYGWAVFDNRKVALVVSGGGGKGVAVHKETGERIYMKMGTAGIGLGLGTNKYQVVFFFQNKTTATNFIENGWQADASATAAAGTDVAEGKTNFVNGVAIYQLTEKGLMLNADIAGTKYWKDTDLN